MALNNSISFSDLGLGPMLVSIDTASCSGATGSAGHMGSTGPVGPADRGLNNSFSDLGLGRQDRLVLLPMN